jgi:hypothetical protein
MASPPLLADSHVRQANIMKRVTTGFASGLLLFVAACSHAGSGVASSRSPSPADAVSPPASVSAPSTPVSASTALTWHGQFAGYGGSAWQSSWGYAAQGSYGHRQLSEVSDRTTPGGGPALRVVYGQGSSANSCGNCPNPGGGQFYTSFANMSHPGFASAEVLYLRYYVKFQAGFDFGRGGKLPGLYGGPISQESGGRHGKAFSTRYMWRDHPVAGSLKDCSPAKACSEVYLYYPQVTNGYGQDIGGAWHWQADDRWHMIEQRVDRTTGNITVWYDGHQVLSTAGALGDVSATPFSGIFFSTFFGGHDTSWGPSKTEYAYFADFAVSTRYIGTK